MDKQFKSTNNSGAFISIERIFPPGGKDESQIHLHGEFNILYDEQVPFARGSGILKHIILVVTRTANYQSVAPFKDVIVFEDDVIETGEGCSGVFNIDIFNKILFDGAGDYYTLCSIGSTTSNILHIKL